jgi:hypothetical protein
VAVLGVSPQDRPALEQQFPDCDLFFDSPDEASGVDVVLIGVEPYSAVALIRVLQKSHPRTRVLTADGLKDLLGGNDWWTSVRHRSKLRRAVAANYGMRVAKYVVLALQPFRWPSVDALDVLHALHGDPLANEESELRRLGYSWKATPETRRRALTRTVEEVGLSYVAELLAFLINTHGARKRRPVGADVLSAYRHDYEWLRGQFSDIPITWPSAT